MSTSSFAYSRSKPGYNTHPSEKHNYKFMSKQRRQKKVKPRNQNRDFICGCGKTYLSYAALYTHAKTKHNGTFPIGTISRAKLLSHRNGPSNSNTHNGQNTQAKNVIEYDRADKFLNDFKRFLDMVPSTKQEPDDPDEKDVLEDYPLKMFQKCSEFQTLFIKMTAVVIELKVNFGRNYLKQIHFIQKEIGNSNSLSCVDVMALFLLNIFPYINKKFYREMVFYTVAYMKMLNDFGWQKLQEMIGRQIETPEDEFCALQSAELVPDFANQFVSEFIFSCLKGSNRLIVKEGSLKCFGKENGQILVTVMLTKLLCEWLRIYNFSKGEVEIANLG